MKLLQRLKNVFTDHLVDPKDLIVKANELLDAVDPVKEKEPLNAYGKPYAIDWDYIGIPFSIERQLDPNGGFLMTNIGYYPLVNPASKAREWCLPLSDEQHQEVIQDFKKWVANNDVDYLLERVNIKKEDNE